MKKLIGMALATTMMLGTSVSAMAEDSLALVVSTLNNPFFVTLKEGAEAKASELGYKLLVLDSQNDPAKELANVEDVLNKDIKLMMINPTDSDAVRSAIKAANRKDIPVVTLDRGASSGKVVSHIASDNVQGGEMAGKLVIEDPWRQGQGCRAARCSGNFCCARSWRRLQQGHQNRFRH